MSGLSLEQRKAIAYALYEYPLGSPELEDAIRRLAPVVESLLAAEREAGAAEALRAAADWAEQAGWPMNTAAPVLRFRAAALIGGE